MIPVAAAAAWTAVRAVGSKILKKGIKKSASKAYKMAKPHLSKAQKYVGKKYESANLAVKSGTKYTNKALLNVQKSGSTYQSTASKKARASVESYNKRIAGKNTPESIKAVKAQKKFNDAIKKGSKVKPQTSAKFVKIPKKSMPKKVNVKNPTKAHLKNKPDSITYTAGAAKRLQPAVKFVGQQSKHVVNTGLYSLYLGGSGVNEGRKQKSKNRTLKRNYKK